MVQPQQTAATMNDQASPSETNESPLSGGAMDGSSQSTLQPVESPAPLIPPPPASEATQDAGHDPVPQQTPSARSSWSASSGRQPGHSPDLSDRVFPIRSVVSVNPAGRTSGEHGYFPRMPDHGQYTASRPDAPPRPRRSDSVSQPAASAVTSPTGDRQATRNRRKHTSSGPISSIQADAARHANSKPLPIFESGACGSEEGHSTHLDRSDTSQPSHAQPAATPADSVPDGHGLILPRFRHVMTDDGHAVITGRDAVLQHCEDEPIHTPGAVQGFGLLLALREDQEGGFSVRYTSENSERIIGYSPKQLFNLASFLDILSEEQQDNLLDHIDFIRDEDADPATNGPEVFSLTVRSSRRKSTKLWCAIHINPAHPDLIICEFELDDDHLYPLRPADNLAKSHSASKSLIYVINDLLDLTKTEEGQDLVKDEIFALSSCIHEATDPFKNEAKRKAIEYEIIEDPGLPSFVYGDSRRVRQAISNVTANAVQHTDSGSVKVQLYVAEVQEQRVLIEVLIQDTGRGMSPKQLDALFRDLEQVNPDSSRQLTADDDSSSSDKRTLGLGLALVARIIRNMNGQLRLKSEEGKGSTFVMQLPFDIPDESPSLSVGSGQQSNPVPDANSASAMKQPQRPSAGEIVLVDAGTAPHAVKSPGETTGNVIETGSFRSQTSSHFSGGGSKGSRTSVHSSLSDAERLIDAIQTPLGIGEHVTGSPSRHRAVKGRHDDSGINVGADAASTARSVSPATTRHSDPRSPGAIVLPSQQTTGFVSVRDTKTPIRPVKVPEEYFDEPQEAPSSSRVLYEIPEPTMQQQPQPAPSETDTATSSFPNLDGTKLQVLIAEDDPINLRVLRKRLEKAGHEVHHAVNGEECALSFREKSETFDVVLMDMQMPIVDGLASTKMIRSFEQSHENCRHSALAAHNGRVPVFAVSASLIEREKNTYADAGFDGWILKPVDFKRLHTLLLGIVDDNVRTSCLYQEGEWERGGWFHSRRCEAREPASDHDHAGGVGLETPQTGAEVAGQDEGLPAPEDAVNASGPETTES
ncbi:hypothetical protein BN1723_015240 [Verticillium longisporum]|uniref:Histidine kinase n=1 Tax=Verticillium longisporum TaxID=100787 RepID=A0A0G4MUZ3_VERLO|nr:hypothetical protein BN1723_015240 [Verticillium longisporum]